VSVDSASYDTSAPRGATSEYSMTPACLQELYGIPSTPATVRTNALAVTAYDSQWAELSDLQLFLMKFRPDMNASTSYSVLSIDGGTQNSSYAGDEADLDIEYTVGLERMSPSHSSQLGVTTCQAVFRTPLSVFWGWTPRHKLYLPVMERTRI